MYVPFWYFLTVLGLLALALCIPLYFVNKNNSQLREEKRKLEEENGKLTSKVSQLTRRNSELTDKLQNGDIYWQNRELRTQVAGLRRQLTQAKSQNTQLEEKAQKRQKAHAEEMSRLQEEARQRQETDAEEISRLKAAMERALQTQRAAHEGEILQLRAAHGEETTKLLGTISRLEASEDGRVEFDELAELWTKALETTNAKLRQRIKHLERQLFENSEVIRLERKVRNQRRFMNHAARAVEILTAQLRMLEEDPSALMLEVQELLGETRP
ncbi:hypothetical protein MK805_05165 [Shimazuella sp. AN120528]|uniref:hypothetical protein n=1 Tax=Shimazuella soli TaxID=1892854 RepID=UPI001F0F78F1|nr:hypothetical protein [Shimazuella soli]MCH5584359.1 hypothetical protein [Shimazuella soli]